MLSIGKRGIPIYYKIFDYTDKKNLITKHVKDGLLQIKELLEPYNYEVIVMADRGFRGTDLLKFIDENLK